MLRTTRFAFVFCVCSMLVSAQQDPRAWFPLKVGARWIYNHEWKSGDRNNPDIDRWVTEETITGLVDIPDGLVVLRKVTRRSSVSVGPALRVGHPDGRLGYVQQGNQHGALVARDSEPYLVRGSCIYPVTGWDAQRRQLSAEFRAYLDEGSVVPDFCFPLQAGQTWGNYDIPWRVESSRAGLSSLVPRSYPGAVLIVSDHFGSGGLQDVWFQKGVGVVATHYLHNGTCDEYTKTLRKFVK